MAKFTHIDEKGNALMVDVGHKQVTSRMALATGRIFMNDECYKAVKDGQVTKGDVLGTARIAGIMAAKKTSSLIPLCHNLLRNVPLKHNVGFIAKVRPVLKWKRLREHPWHCLLYTTCAKPLIRGWSFPRCI